MISGVQSNLHTELKAKYTDLTESDIAIYPRVYKTPVESGGYKLEWFDGKDYKEVYLDDKLGLSLFFVADDRATTEDKFVYSQDVKIVVIADLNKIYPQVDPQGDSNDRMDHNLQYEFARILDSISDRKFDINEITMGIPSVFRGMRVEKLMNDDMQPYHIFCVETEMHYYITETC